MAKILNAIEDSFEQDPIGGLSDILAGISFLAVIGAVLTWLTF